MSVVGGCTDWEWRVAQGVHLDHTCGTHPTLFTRTPCGAAACLLHALALLLNK